MRWTWHEPKNEWTLLDRGIDFPYALRIFNGLIRLRRTDRKGERRYLAIGVVDGKHYVVVYTKRIEGGELVRRVISVRRAWDSEEKTYNAGR
jgi:uncharacterized DUF497 family protein